MRSVDRRRLWLAAAAVCSMLLGSCTTQQPAAERFASHPVPGACETPAPKGQEPVGCYLNTVQQLGRVSEGPLYWHIYAYPNRASAEAARVRGRSAVVETFGKVWLYTLARQDWTPGAGTRAAVIGPLETKPGVPYAVRYMQATFAPGMQTRVHVHTGPEAWYVVSGAQCLRTPQQTMVVRAGETAIVPEGPPMILSTVGEATRRSLVLVLHDSRKPWNVDHGEWQPAETCPAA